MKIIPIQPPDIVVGFGMVSALIWFRTHYGDPMSKRITLYTLGAIGIAALAGCKTGPEPLEPKERNSFNPSSQLESFESCSEVDSYLSEVMLNTMLRSYYPYYSEMVMWAEEGDVAADSESGSEGPSDYTTTNVQEEGVDELDNVKTDGEYIYYSQYNQLHIVDSWPVEEASKIATVELEGNSRGIFLRGDQLFVVSNIHSSDQLEISWNGTRVSVYDITDRSNPVLDRTVEMDGYVADARMIGSDVYLVLNHYLDFPYELWNLVHEQTRELPEVDWSLADDAFNAHIDELRAEAAPLFEEVIASYVQENELLDGLPQWAEDGIVEDMHGCTTILRPGHAEQYNIMSLVNLDLESNDLNATGLFSDGWTVYASQENLYVAQSGRWWWGWGGDMNSHIHKFSLNGGEAPSYAASGEVDGWLYDQFAMSEYDGHLRVASTESDWWFWSDEGDGGNNITVLQDNGKGVMETVGAVTKIAPGEQIYAARMFGDKGYIVTFRQIDPLFTLDLSDPTDPVVTGELKIPGYSAYLHPLGDDHLLAVGMAGDMDGNLDGLAVNIFDVSDMQDPQLAHEYVIESDGWAWSEALWDHHAFTFHRGILSIPAYSYSYDTSSGVYDQFSGLISFSIDTEEGIEEHGRVDHQSLVSDSECIYNVWYADNGYEYECGYWEWQSRVRRSIYIEDSLFSVSDYGMKVNDLYEPETEIAEVKFYPMD
jgi:uncharacterized secreted protein with C-terminal beta-propeller domain